MRTMYREHLNAFSEDLQIMSDTVRRVMTYASKALIDGSLDDAEAALTEADTLKEIRVRCEERSMALLALESPVASDLRQVFTSIYIVEDFNRMGALARHVANIARLRHPDYVYDDSMRPTVVELARLVDTMSDLIHDQLISPDVDGALEMSQFDDELDALNQHLLSTVTSRGWEGSNRVAVDLALVSRYYERYADHCVNVAARIVFLVTGLTPERYVSTKDGEGRNVEMDERFRELERYFSQGH